MTEKLASNTAPTLTEALANDTGFSSTDKITSNPAIIGTADANATVHFTVDGSAVATTATANASGAWSFAPAGLANGQHTVVASETNASGQTGTAALTFTLDTLAPDTSVVTKPPSLTSQTSASFGWGGTENVGGSGIDHYLYQLDGGNWTSTNSTAQSFSSLSNGSHTFQVEAVDAAGNVDATPASYGWKVHTVAPAPLGPQATSAPTGAIILNPGDDVSALVYAAPAGATFYFEPGVYRGVSVWPKDGQTFIGAQGAILNGSVVLTDWAQSGNLWVIGGQTQRGPVFTGAEFVAGTEMPGYPETVFLDNTPLKPVDALSKVVPGTFYFDYAANNIYIADNPASHTVEAGKLTDAFHGNATNVTVQNLVIEKYDPQIQDGAIHGDQSWTIKDNEVRLNYAVGITAHDGSQIIGNFVHDNGQMGLGGHGNNILVQGNELASNGFWSGISPYWEAGGFKFVDTDNLVVRGNYSHDNNGSGMWTDGSNIHTLYEDNLVVHNTINGIQHEISYDAIIRNNTLVGNGYGDTRGWAWGAEIDIQNSQNVQVYGNRIDMTGGNNGIILIQQDRGSGTYGTYTTTGNQIHDNIIVDRDGLQISISSGNSHGAIGGFADYNVSGMLNGGNTWSNNQYFMSDGLGRFQWGYYETFAQFQAATGETGSISQSYPDTTGWLTPGISLAPGGIFEIGSGYVLDDFTISSGLRLEVASGGLVSGATVLSGGTLLVLSSGSAIGTVISSGGTEIIQTGFANGTIVLKGGQQIVSASASNTIASSGGTIRAVGGEIDAAVISSGGSALISAGFAFGAIINGGTVTLSSGSVAVITVISGGVQTISSGGSATSTTITSGSERVMSGGLAKFATVNGAAGLQLVSAGGSASNTSVNLGTQKVLLGGLALSTVASGASFLDNFGTVRSAVVSSGAQAYMESGGVGTGTLVLGGGIGWVLLGGVASGTTLSNGAFERDQGATTGTQILQGAQQYVESGGRATSTTVTSGGIQRVFLGGSTVSTTISTGAYQLDSGGAVSTSILSGASQYIYGGGSASATNIATGAIQYVLAGGSATGAIVSSGAYQVDSGTAVSATVSSGGAQYVYNLASAVSTTVLGGGLQYMLAGGTASGTTVSGGGYQIVYGSASGTTLVGSGYQYVYGGGSASSTIVSSGALQYVVAGGVASGVTVSSGGLQYVYGSASGTTMSGSGALGYVFNGGSASNLAIIGSGATAQINVGGILNGGSVLSGALEYILGSGSNILVSGTGALMQLYGATTSITVGSGGIEVVNSGTVDSAALITLGGDQIVIATATAISATVATSGRQDVLGSASATLVSGLNGREVVSSGGHVTGGRVFSGGIEQVLSGGVTTGTFVSGIGGASATELLNAGGVASNTSVGSGGRILVSGGTTSNAVISSGASELVFSGGAASSTTVSGGTETVSSGGVLAGATISGGGLVDIKSGGTAGSSTITISSGTLKLDDSQNFSASISGLANAAQVVDLADINFATLQTVAYSGTTLSGTLTVSDGTHVAHLNLIGNYLAATFTSANDGGGGTLITDPPAPPPGQSMPMIPTQSSG